VGTFEYFAARRDVEALDGLVAYALKRHYPARDSSPLELLDAVASAQASLIAKWQLVGFIHGVMNTDNTLISGETIDYGPCAFMDAYDPATVFSSIDRYGRYAYGNQPAIAQWNLACLARAVLPLIGESDDDLQRAQEILDGFPSRFELAYEAGMAQKLGLAALPEEDWGLVKDLLDTMKTEQSDFTLTFRHLTDRARPDGVEGDDIADAHPQSPALEPWIARWLVRLDAEPGTAHEKWERMVSANPALIPRNHNVEAALDAAVDERD
jgi:uncharacterized protein YdiU (UPF0061 family)